MFFIDNDSARFALISMNSPVEASADIILQVAKLDMIEPGLRWYARVPTVCNPADAPSRLDFKKLIEDGGLIVDPVFPTP